jgi:predicted dehydrogenase
MRIIDSSSYKRKWNIGIVGAGSIVESVHLPVLKSFSNVHISWIFDLNTTRLFEITKMYGIKSIHFISEDNINEIDCCLIAIPIGARNNIYNLLEGKSKKIYVEKPFATTRLMHEELILRLGDDVHVGFQRRFYPWVKIVKEIVCSKLFGSLNRVKFNQGFFNIKSGSSFIGDKSLSGGGVVIESAIHGLDLINYIINPIYIELLEINATSIDGIDYHNLGKIALRNGVDNNVIIDYEISCIMNFLNGFEFEFENCTLMIDFSPIGNLRVVDKLNQQFSFGFFSVNDATNNQIVMDSFKQCWELVLSDDLSLQNEKTNAKGSLNTTEFIDKIYRLVK